MENTSNKHYATLGNLVAEIDKDAKDILRRNNLIGYMISVRDAHILVADVDNNKNVVANLTDINLGVDEDGNLASIVVYGDKGRLAQGVFFTSLSVDDMVRILSYLEKVYY